MTLSFTSLGLSEARVSHLESMGYEEPTAIQAEAIPHLLEAIRLNPGRTSVYINLSWALLQDGRFRETIAFLEQNMERLGKWPQVHLNLGAAYFYIGDRASARRELMILRQFGDPNFALRLARLLGEEPLQQ